MISIDPTFTPPSPQAFSDVWTVPVDGLYALSCDTQAPNSALQVYDGATFVQGLSMAGGVVLLKAGWTVVCATPVSIGLYGVRLGDELT